MLILFISPIILILISILVPPWRSMSIGEFRQVLPLCPEIREDFISTCLQGSLLHPFLGCFLCCWEQFYISYIRSLKGVHSPCTPIQKMLCCCSVLAFRIRWMFIHMLLLSIKNCSDLSSIFRVVGVSDAGPRVCSKVWALHFLLLHWSTFF